MRHKGRFTSLQGQTLKDRMDSRIGEDTEAFTNPGGDIESAKRGSRVPPNIDLDTWREGEDIVDNPAFNEQKRYEEMGREDEREDEERVRRLRESI